MPEVEASGFHTDRPGDCVVQGATRHAWRNQSGRAVKMAVVMIRLAPRSR